MIRRFRLSCKYGAFLLEALVATVILGFGLTAIIRAFVIGLEAHQRNREYLQAAALLDNKLTEFLVQRYFNASMAGKGEFDEPFDAYRYEVSVEEVSGSKALTEVTVAISWPGRRDDRSIEATTYLFVEPQEKG